MQSNKSIWYQGVTEGTNIILKYKINSGPGDRGETPMYKMSFL